jgi:hypothetical protein
MHERRAHILAGCVRVGNLDPDPGLVPARRICLAGRVELAGAIAVPIGWTRRIAARG